MALPLRPDTPFSRAPALILRITASTVRTRVSMQASGSNSAPFCDDLVWQVGCEPDRSCPEAALCPGGRLPPSASTLR